MEFEDDIYTAYYMRQAGSGFGNIYSGPSFQRGMGIGMKLGILIIFNFFIKIIIF